MASCVAGLGKGTSPPGAPKDAIAVADRFTHADGEHERRLADRFTPVNDAVLRGILEERNRESLRRVSDGGDLVGARGMSEEPAVLAPLQFFAGEPAHSLDEPAFDLATIDPGIQRFSDVVENIHGDDALHPGIAVDLDFADGGAIGEIIEGFSFSLVLS